MPLTSTGALPRWPPLLATRGPGATSARHAHHAMHLVVAVEGSLRARCDGDARWIEAAGVLTRADVGHAIDARGTDVVLVFFDPESDVGLSLTGAVGDLPLRALTSRERAALAPSRLDPVAMMRDGGAAFTRELALLLGADAPSPRRLHPRVKKLLRHLEALPQDGDVALPTLAAEVGLSPGRLMHVFTQSVGLPLRAYLLWCKLQRAAVGVVSGLPLGSAAALAGFSDAAHMSRAFRRMFGVPPSTLRPARVA